MATDGEAVPIDLVAVPKARLNNPFTALNLAQKVGGFEQVVNAEIPTVTSNYGAQQQAAKTRRGINRKVE